MDAAIVDFNHPVLEETISAIGGEYRLKEERRAFLADGELLYYTGYFVIDRSCCGVGGSAYALIAGFVAQWKYTKDAQGRPVSQVHTVKNERDRDRIAKMIKKEDPQCQVVFY